VHLPALAEIAQEMMRLGLSKTVNQVVEADDSGALR